VDQAEISVTGQRGDNEPTERYKLYYCKTFEIPVTEFGATAPRTDAPSPIATVNTHGLTVSLGTCPAGS